MLRNTVNDDNGRSQCRMDELIHKNHNLHLSLRAFRSTRIEQQALQEVPRTIDSQNCRTVKVQQPKDWWSTVKPLRRARQNFNPQSQLSMEVTPLISALSCNEKSLDTITKLLYCEHYERLGTASVDDQFDDSWKEHIEKKVTEYSEISSLQKDKVLDRGISYAEIKKCSKSLQNNKTGGNDGLVGELFKYGGKGMANLLKVLYGVVWTEESIPKQWRQGLIVSLYKKGDAEDPGNYRGITLLNVVGKLFCKILNNRLVSRLEAERALHEGQAGFREKRSCVDNIFTLNEIVQGRMREGKHTYAFFLMFRKHLTQFGMMVYGLSYGNLGLGVGCGELLRICMTSHRVLFYWREKYLSNSI